MLDFVFAPENLPLAVALLLMLMIGLVEALGLGAAAAHVDFDADAGGTHLLRWLGVGQVPLLMLLVVLLALFGIVGLAVQQFAQSFLGKPLSPWLAAAAALAAALQMTGVAANLASSAVSAALRYRAQASIVDGLMKELGFDGSTLESLVSGAVPKATAEEATITSVSPTSAGEKA